MAVFKKITASYKRPYQQMGLINADKLKQYLLLAAIIALAIVLGWQLHSYIPGFLVATTLYILMRKYYLRLTIIKNWKKIPTALLFIFIALIIIGLPVVLLLQLLIPKFHQFISDPSQLNNSINVVINHVHEYFPQIDVSKQRISGLMKSLASSLPTFLGATFETLLNLLLAFFFLFFMLIDGRKMEHAIQRFLPLKGENVDNLWEATRIMVVSNAIGLPLMAAIQAVTATIGYLIFGVSDALLWGIVTGAFSLFPIVGTSLVWIPISIFLFANDQPGQAIGVLAYSSIVIVNLDHLMRFTLLKKIGNVHPIITALGVLVGVPLFGFMGFIFGPLLISYLFLLLEVYRIEFTYRPADEKEYINPPDNP
ncbi:MAG TPA: AI-2E family transporter [Flavipsychrobacter sp.]|nr:AI-2E family transporter [Flavipsychrobacter sp.]